MAPVEKVTVSLPADLLARVEERRARTGTSRSRMVADLLWRGWRELDQEDREARYSAAYAAQPESAPEADWIEGSSAGFGEDAEQRPAAEQGRAAR